MSLTVACSNTESYRIKPILIESYKIIQSHAVSYRIIQSHAVSFRIIKSDTVSYRFIQSHTVLYKIIQSKQCHTESYKVKKGHTRPCRTLQDYPNFAVVDKNKLRLIDLEPIASDTNYNQSKSYFYGFLKIDQFLPKLIFFQRNRFFDQRSLFVHYFSKTSAANAKRKVSKFRPKPILQKESIYLSNINFFNNY